MFGLGLIGKGLRMIRNLIGRPLRDWSEWADKNPAYAARQLESLAVVLAARAGAIAEKRGNGAWRVRQDRHLAKGFEEYAAKLREEASRREVHVRSDICKGFENVCRDAIAKAKAE